LEKKKTYRKNYKDKSHNYLGQITKNWLRARYTQNKKIRKDFETFLLGGPSDRGKEKNLSHLRRLDPKENKKD